MAKLTMSADEAKNAALEAFAEGLDRRSLADLAAYDEDLAELLSGAVEAGASVTEIRAIVRRWGGTEGFRNWLEAAARALAADVLSP